MHNFNRPIRHNPAGRIPPARKFGERANPTTFKPPVPFKAEDSSADRLLRLLEKDQLLFHLLSPVGSPPPSAMRAEQAFRQAFLNVWGRIPCSDRAHLLSHLRDRLEPIGSAEPDTEEPRLRIQVVIPRRGASARPLGHLAFPYSLLGESAARLPERILQTLAETYRYTTCDHWKLIVKVIEDPMDRWEEGEGRDATDAAHAKKLNGLEKRFLRKHEAELALILKRWGFPDA